MSKILLIAPPYGNLYAGVNIRMSRWGFIPYGLASIGGKLRADGHPVRILDATCAIKRWEDISRAIEEFSPEYLGISITTPQVPVSLKICEMAKIIKPDCITIVGGPHPSAIPEDMLKDENIDIVVTGEGEITMSHIASGMPLNNIKGIYYREKGRLIKNPPQDLIDDLDSLPFPIYEQLPIDRYGTPYMGNSVGIITGRGCPFNCSFCASKAVFGTRCRFRSVSSILDEISWFKDKYKIRAFSFWDDTFTMQNERIDELCSQLTAHNFNIRWSCTTRVDTLSLELLRKMKKSGCSVIHLGIESADEFVLARTKKGITLNEAENAVSWARSLNIDTYGYFILGLPFDTKKTLAKTINFSKRIGLDYAQFALLTPLPGSEIWDLVKERNLLKLTCGDFEKFSRYGRAIVELPGVPSEMLDRFYRKAYFEFYFRPAYIFQTLRKIRSWRQLLNRLKMFFGLLHFLS